MPIHESQYNVYRDLFFSISYINDDEFIFMLNNASDCRLLVFVMFLYNF